MREEGTVSGRTPLPDSEEKIIGFITNDVRLIHGLCTLVRMSVRQSAIMGVCTGVFLMIFF